MKAWFCILILGGVALTPAAGAREASPWPETEEKLPPRPWIHAMEASMTPASANPEVGPLPWTTWMGWALATLFFFYLLNLHLKMKRREQFLLRGGERDFFLLPPARNRRNGSR